MRRTGVKNGSSKKLGLWKAPERKGKGHWRGKGENGEGGGDYRKGRRRMPEGRGSESGAYRTQGVVGRRAQVGRRRYRMEEGE